MKKLIIFAFLIFVPFNVSALTTNARSAILMDMDTKRILYSKNINEQRSVASISKIMTAILAIESNHLDDMVTIGDEIDASYGSGIYIEKGEKISLRDLVYGLMLRSGNDASYAIAKYVGGDNFVKMMNDKAKQIGMINTNFNNPNGLDEEAGNYSTAYDMALLTSYASHNKEYQKIVSTKEYQVKTNKKTYTWTNKNKLLFSYDYTTGGKTGFTKKAKRTLVTTARKNDLNLVAVTLVDGDDFNDHKKMFEYGFDNYYHYQLLKAGNMALDNDVYRAYDLKIKENYNYTLKEGESVYLKFELNKEPKEGQVGVVKVMLENNLLHLQNVYATKKDEKKFNLWKWIKKIW